VLEESLLMESKGGIQTHSVINADEKKPSLFGLASHNT
jgi:hypothetical protein